MIFLQHGVIRAEVPSYHKKYCDFDIFICSAKREKKVIKDTLGYDKELMLTGLARFDNLYNTESSNKILFMPTYDKRLYGKSENSFTKSDYFKGINKFLNSEKLSYLLDKYDFYLIFVPHYMMMEYVSYFEINSKRIKIIKNPKDKLNNVSHQIKTSSLLITNYSSVLFDFAYMKKPAIYYQFNEFHYEEDFDYETEGFGRVVEDADSLFKELERLLKNNCEMDEEYIKRAEHFFEYIDDKNCKRNYEAIKKLNG